MRRTPCRPKVRRSLRAALLVSAIALTASARPPAAEEAGEPASGVAFLGPDLPWKEVLARAEAAGKLVLVNLYTDWCGWCKRLDADVFSRPDVAIRMEPLMCVRYDADRGEGLALAAAFCVRAFPTLLVLDAKGAEIDRIGGYLPAEAFLAEVERILADRDTLRSLRRAHQASAGDPEAALRLAGKLLVCDLAAARRLLGEVAHAVEGKDPERSAEVAYRIAGLEADAREMGRALAAYEALVAGHPTSPWAARGALTAARILETTDPARGLGILAAAKDAFAAERALERERAGAEAALHFALAQAAWAREGELAGDDPELLNRLAWTAFLRGTNLDQAIGWARRAATASPEDAVVLDTLANLLFAADRVDEAVEVQQRALDAVEGDGPLLAEVAESYAKFRAVQEFRVRTGRQAVPAAPVPPAPPDPKAAGGN